MIQFWSDIWALVLLVLLLILILIRINDSILIRSPGIGALVLLVLIFIKIYKSIVIRSPGVLVALPSPRVGLQASVEPMGWGSTKEWRWYDGNDYDDDYVFWDDFSCFCLSITKSCTHSGSRQCPMSLKKLQLFWLLGNLDWQQRQGERVSWAGMLSSRHLSSDKKIENNILFHCHFHPHHRCHPYH